MDRLKAKLPTPGHLVVNFFPAPGHLTVNFFPAPGHLCAKILLTPGMPGGMVRVRIERDITPEGLSSYAHIVELSRWCCYPYFLRAVKTVKKCQSAASFCRPAVCWSECGLEEGSFCDDGKSDPLAKYRYLV